MHRNRRERRTDLDHEAMRYFVYRCRASDGGVLYVGRSCDVQARLKAHRVGGAAWVDEVATVDTWGPMTWPDAVQAERRMIVAEQPPNNRMFVTTHRQEVVHENASETDELRRLGFLDR